MAARRVVLCADDYGMTDGVSAGIRELADAGRISAAGAMVNGPSWAGAAAEARRPGWPIALGLHLTLTWGAPLGPMPRFAPEGRLPPLGQVVREALAGQLPGKEVEEEIGRQLDRFRDAVGRGPDFVDGHQHVHALPGVRLALMRALDARSGWARPWLRDPGDRLGAIVQRPQPVKAGIVALMGLGFGRLARARGHETNDGFAGFSSFGEGLNLDRDFDGFLAAPGARPLLMCHPGRVGDGAGLDAVREARERELAYLASPDFPALLRRREVVLAPSPV